MNRERVGAYPPRTVAAMVLIGVAAVMSLVQFISQIIINSFSLHFLILIISIYPRSYFTTIPILSIAVFSIIWLLLILFKQETYAFPTFIVLCFSIAFFITGLNDVFHELKYPFTGLGSILQFFPYGSLFLFAAAITFLLKNNRTGRNQLRISPNRIVKALLVSASASLMLYIVISLICSIVFVSTITWITLFWLVLGFCVPLIWFIVSLRGYQSGLLINSIVFMLGLVLSVHTVLYLPFFWTRIGFQDGSYITSLQIPLDVAYHFLLLYGVLLLAASIVFAAQWCRANRRDKKERILGTAMHSEQDETDLEMLEWGTARDGCGEQG